MTDARLVELAKADALDLNTQWVAACVAIDQVRARHEDELRPLLAERERLFQEVQDAGWRVDRLVRGATP